MAEKHGAAQAWLLQCPPGLGVILKKEMIYNGLLQRNERVFLQKQRNHDLLFFNRLQNTEKIQELRVAEVILKCPLFGRFKISKRQLEIMAEELRKIGPRRLVVTVAGRHYQRQDLLRWLEKEMSQRGYNFDSEQEQEVWMFCIDQSWYFGLPQHKSRLTS